MATPQPLKPQATAITAALSFITTHSRSSGDKPYEIIGVPESEVPPHLKTNIVYETQDSVQVTDLRSVQPQPTLEGEGFTWIHHRSKHVSEPHVFHDVDLDNGIVELYLQETIEMVKKKTGAKDVFVYDWRYRKNGTVYKTGDPDTDPRTSRYFVYAPIGNVHTDYSYDGGTHRLKLHLSKEEQAEIKSKGSNVLMLNVWRPLVPVENAPLAVCDRRSVLPEDVVLVDKVLPNNVEEETCIIPKDYHKWYYISSQQPDEVLLFIQWEDDGTNSQTLSVSHGALAGVATNTGPTPRESVENSQDLSKL
ncbi:hypothetical protein FALBO_11815 [Fusarium albosuccineum]|uniref:Uncharacterized protein n=1 Tax=Fusarium albosuccineum TaxID=1237068 RepID=A0A8H4L567_9HYPO|nr:hypothetical protein FALBO_11815 [Fusarium albosuccineum]